MTRLPTHFISHGSPMLALDPGLAGPRLTTLGQRLPRPEAVVVVSPHWMTRQPRVASTAAPQTVHDFGSFCAGALHAELPRARPPGAGVACTSGVERGGLGSRS